MVCQPCSSGRLSKQGGAAGAPYYRKQRTFAAFAGNKIALLVIGDSLVINVRATAANLGAYDPRATG